jgi:precorrin-6x reductase
MTNIVTTLKAQAAAAGTNLTAICKKAGVPRQTVERWKNKEPKTFQLLRKLEAAIKEAKAKGGDDPRDMGAQNKPADRSTDC